MVVYAVSNVVVTSSPSGKCGGGVIPKWQIWWWCQPQMANMVVVSSPHGTRYVLVVAAINVTLRSMPEQQISTCTAMPDAASTGPWHLLTKP